MCSHQGESKQDDTSLVELPDTLFDELCEMTDSLVVSRDTRVVEQNGDLMLASITELPVTVEKGDLVLVLEVEHFQIDVSHLGGDVIMDTDPSLLTLLAKFETLIHGCSDGDLGYSWVEGHAAGRKHVVADSLLRMPVDGVT